MYERFFGLRERPFDLTPNPRYLFVTPNHREALSNLHYGISARRGVTLLIGEAGTGKTTLVRAVLESERARNTECVYLNNPMLTREEFLEFLADAFELGDDAARSKTRLVRDLERLLRERRAKGIVTALLVDEAQALPIDLLEEVRLLANIETDTEKLLPLVLAGQPQLAAKLNEPELRQLKQRVALRCELRPLERTETATYISRRIKIAGGDSATMFTREAVELVHLCSRGIPRTISVICDNALVGGFAAQQRPIGYDLVHEVCRDFDLNPPTMAPRPVPRAAPVSKAASPAPASAAVPMASSNPDLSVRELFSAFSRPRRFSLF